MAKRIMRNFVIREISGVDRPAQAHARAAILKRADVEGKAGFGDDDVPVGDSRTRLRLAYEGKRRSYPRLDNATHLGWAWRSLSNGDRTAILAEEDDGQDPTFDHENVDVGKLADFLLEVRAELIGKAQPLLTRAQSMAEAIDEKPELFRAARAAKRADMNKGNTGPTTAVVAARHFALQLLTKHAEEIRKAQPTLSLQAARTEARRRFPEIAARERA